MEPFYLRRDPALSLSKGFTLIELVVVTAIIMVIMMIVLTSQTTFNKTLILQNTAYDIALTLREAETFGLGNRAPNTAALMTNVGYGIHIENGSPGASMLLFADTSPSPASGNCHGIPTLGGASAPNAQSGDCVYTAGSSGDVKMSNYTLNNGITISNFCALDSTSKWVCNHATGSCVAGLSKLDIVFARPSQNVFVRTNGSASAAGTFPCIKISSPQGTSRFVSVLPSGEVGAFASCPCP